MRPVQFTNAAAEPLIRINQRVPGCRIRVLFGLGDIGQDLCARSVRGSAGRHQAKVIPFPLPGTGKSVR